MTCRCCCCPPRSNDWSRMLQEDSNLAYLFPWGDVPAPVEFIHPGPMRPLCRECNKPVGGNETSFVGDHLYCKSHVELGKEREAFNRKKRTISLQGQDGYKRLKQRVRENKEDE